MWFLCLGMLFMERIAFVDYKGNFNPAPPNPPAFCWFNWIQLNIFSSHSQWDPLRDLIISLTCQWITSRIWNSIIKRVSRGCVETYHIMHHSRTSLPMLSQHDFINSHLEHSKAKHTHIVWRDIYYLRDISEYGSAGGFVFHPDIPAGITEAWDQLRHQKTGINIRVALLSWIHDMRERWAKPLGSSSLQGRGLACMQSHLLTTNSLTAWPQTRSPFACNMLCCHYRPLSHPHRPFLMCTPVPGQGWAAPAVWWDGTEPDSRRCPSWLRPERPPKPRRGWSRSHRCGATCHRW